MKDIIFTVDLESDNFQKPAEKILSILKKHKAKATFFVVADKIKDNIKTIKKISKSHEIASHGLSHKNLKKLDKQSLWKEIKESKEIIEGYGFECNGFRAPFHIFPKNLFFLLKKAGYSYDSSICRAYYPGRYNMRSALNYPHILEGIYEFPISSFSLFKIPFGLSFMKAFSPFYPNIKINNAYTFYMHDYDIDTPPKGKGITSLFLKRNPKKGEAMLAKLLSKNYNFTSCKEYLNTTI